MLAYLMGRILRIIPTLLLSVTVIFFAARVLPGDPAEALLVGRVEDELYAIAKAAEQEPRLREALTDQTLPLENRTALLRDVLGDRAVV